MTCFKCVAQPARDAAHRVCDSCHSPSFCHVCARASAARATERAAKRAAERKAKAEAKAPREEVAGRTASPFYPSVSSDF